MEIKKSPKADLQNKKGIFSLLGLCIALLAMIGVFSWSKAELKVELYDQNEAVIENEVIEITRQEPPKIEPPKITAPVISDVLDIVKNDIVIKDDNDLFNMDVTENTTVEIVNVTEKEEEVIEEEVPLVRAEKMPTFQGGDQNTFRSWLQKNVKYPPAAEENNITGKVTIRFVVEKDGSVSNITVLSSPDRLLSDECIGVLKRSPKWEPGSQNGKAVRVQVVSYVTFQL